MACNGANQPLLSGKATSTAQKINGEAPKRRGLRRVRSAPLAEFWPTDINGDAALPRSESIFGRLHPSFKKVVILLMVYLGLGTVCFYIIRNQIKGDKTNGILDAVYFCVVTMTTVGYGDLVPNSDLAKLLACAFVFTGMALIGLVLSKAADYLVEKQEILLVNALHMNQKVNRLEIMKEIENNKVKFKFYTALILLVLVISAGTIFLSKVESLDLVDAFYCVCSTITTLGYGDKSFSTEGGRIFAVFWILAGTISLAQFFLYIAELNTEQRQKALVKCVLTRRMTNVDLEAADLDDDGVVGAAEFVLFKLREMGKICREDISPIMEEFEELDVDQSGTLSASDINLAQSAEARRSFQLKWQAMRVVFMLGHLNSIILMVSNAAKQARLPMAAGSPTLTDDENSPKKRSFRSSKTSSVAANYGFRTDLPDLKRLGIYFGIYFGVGTTSFFALKNHIRGHKTNDVIDSLYLCVQTMTTVGYGDLVPHSVLSQLICTIFITIGMCLFGIVVKIAASYLVEKQQMVLVNTLHTAQKIGQIEALKEIENIKIDYTKCVISLIAMAAHFVLGVFVLVTVEGMDFEDAVYCACTTMTTVGFGDESFSSEFGRMFGVLWITTGTSCLGQLFLYIAEVYTDIQTKKLVKWALTSNVVAMKDLEAAHNVEDDKVYGAADFILYKLKETGKIKQEDISVAMKDFEAVIKDLGVDEQSVSDVVLKNSII
ncbi:hypothetical protein DITRI_Ditri01bG0195700 [Diplodiscus trichospermus]